MSNEEVRFRIVVDDNGVAPAMQRTSDGFARVGAAAVHSSGQTQQAMRMLPAQLSDVATQIAGGQSPFLVLMQQGLQTRDMFGSFRAAATGILAALSPAVVGIGALVTAAGAGVAAAIQGQREWSEYRNIVQLSGNAAGLTADRLDALTRSVSENSGATVGQARDITLALAAQGTVSARVLDDMALAVARVADASGQDAKTVAADFAKMSGGVADWAAEHNKAWNFISAEQYKYIKRLEDQGKAEEAMIFVSKRAIEQHESQRESLGYLESAWNSIGKAASSAWSAMLGIGKEQTLGERIAAVERDLAAAEGRLADAKNSPLPAGPAGMSEMKRERDRLSAQLAALYRDQATENRLAEESSAAAQRERDKIKALRDPKKNPLKSDGLKNYNPAGLFVGPEYLSPDDLRRQFRQAEIASMDATNLDADIRANKAADERLRRQQQLLDELTGANARANVELIADDQRRALAQIDLERKQLQQRINAIYASGGDRAEAERQADETAAAQRAAVSQRFAKNTALVTYEETRDALANAFRDSKNPLRAFADALGNIVFQRLSTSVADALLTGSFSAGGGGLLGGLVNGLTSLFSGGSAGYGNGAAFGLSGALANGGPALAGRAYLVGERGPEILRMGGQGGTVIPNHALGGPTQVNLQVINNTGTPMKSSASQGPDGSIQLMLDAFDQDMAGRIGNGQGATVQALQARFNLRPSLG